MTDRQPTERPPSEQQAPKRVWSEPTMEVVPAIDTEGSVQPAFPVTDAVTGTS